MHSELGDWKVSRKIVLLNPFLADCKLPQGIRIFSLCSFYENSVAVRDPERHCNPLVFVSVCMCGWMEGGKSAGVLLLPMA